jgi:hypothetical protein
MGFWDGLIVDFSHSPSLSHSPPKGSDSLHNQCVWAMVQLRLMVAVEASIPHDHGVSKYKIKITFHTTSWSEIYVTISHYKCVLCLTHHAVMVIIRMSVWNVTIIYRDSLLTHRLISITKWWNCRRQFVWWSRETHQTHHKIYFISGLGHSLIYHHSHMNAHSIIKKDGLSDDQNHVQR